MVRLSNDLPLSSKTLSLISSPASSLCRLRQAIRKACGQEGTSYPIEIVQGSDAAHYVNKSGDIIHHPNAYRRAWGKPIYVASTLRIVVGAKWLSAQGWKEFLD